MESPHPPMDDLPEILVGTPDELARLCGKLAALPRFGLDTEFVGEETYHPRLCLVQIATDEGLYLVDPLAIPTLDAFWKIVADPAKQVIVHAGREEVRLCHLWCGQPPGRIFDLQIAAGLVGCTYPMGHGSLVGQLLRKTLAKGETLTEWRTRPLTKAQIRYAFDDVRYLLALWKKLSDKLQKLGRETWAEEEFAKMTASATPEEPGLAPGTDKWRKLRGAGSLDRRHLAGLRELYEWREGLAAQLNRPARAVVRDDLLVEIARRNPKNDRDLSTVRGIQKRFIPQMLDAIERARALPMDQCPEPFDRGQDPPQLTLIANVLNAVLADYCIRSEMAPNLAATSTEVKEIIRARMQGEVLPEESMLTRGWRAEFVLPTLLEFLDGRRGLKIENVRSETPFGYDPE